MSDFTIHFVNFNAGLLLITSIIILALYFVVYKRNKNIPKILIFSRILIFLVLILLLMKPVINFQKSRQLAPEFLIFLDNSASFQRQKGFDRNRIVENLSILGNNLIEKGVDLKYYTFADKLDKIAAPEELTGEGANTNLSKVFDFLRTVDKNRNIRGVLVVSDGIITEGQTPATIKKFGKIPVYTTGLGDTARSLDPSILSWEVPGIVNTDDTVDISSEINPASRSDRIKVELKANDKTIQSKIIESTDRYQRQTLNFQYIPKSPGLKSLSIVLRDENDNNPLNNQLTTKIKIQSKSNSYVIIGSKFNFDGKYLYRALDKMENTSCYQLVDFNNKWVSKDNVSDILNKNWNLVILNGYPSSNSSQNHIQTIKQKLESENPAVIAIVNHNLNLNKLNNLLGYKIFDSSTATKAVKNKAITANPALRSHHFNIYLEGIAGKEWWRDLPPISYPYTSAKLDDSFEALIETLDKNENPVLAFTKSNQSISRTAVLTGSNFWKWQMMTLDGEKEGFFENMVVGIANHLTDTSTSTPVQIYPDKNKYRLGEQITLSGNVLDVSGTPMQNATIQTVLKKNQEDYKNFFLPFENGKYQTSFVINEPGVYNLQLTAKRNNKLIDDVEHSISVIDQPVEMQTIEFNKEGLQQIANRSGGRFVQIDNLTEIVQDLKFGKEEISLGKKIKLWQWKYIFLFLIVIYLAELIYRKLRGYL